MKSNGFTTIELIVVLSIIILISSFMIIYSKISSSQIELSVEQVNLIQDLNRAKNLALATYTPTATSTCGYGIKINYNNPPSYVLFKYDKTNNISSCESIAYLNINQQDPAYQEIEKHVFSKNIKLKQDLNYLDAIFFIPPDPKILIWRSGGSKIQDSDPNQNAYIYLTTADDSFSKQITVNTGGQITF